MDSIDPTYCDNILGIIRHSDALNLLLSECGLIVFLVPGNMGGGGGGYSSGDGGYGMGGGMNRSRMNNPNYTAF